MSEFQLYFSLGMEHILDVLGFDHILFVIALCVMFTIKNLKYVLILITAFTIGHSVTLALSVYKIVVIDPAVIEFLIPTTILLTAFSNIIFRDTPEGSNLNRINYGLALGFGLIHGMGFSNYLQSILGSDSNIVKQLFAFNIGLEVGQIIIVAIFLVIATIAERVLNIKRKDWITIVSALIMGMAVMLMIETKFW